MKKNCINVYTKSEVVSNQIIHMLTNLIIDRCSMCVFSTTMIYLDDVDAAHICGTIKSSEWHAHNPSNGCKALNCRLYMFI